MKVILIKVALAMLRVALKELAGAEVLATVQRTVSFVEGSPSDPDTRRRLVINAVKERCAKLGIDPPSDVVLNFAIEAALLMLRRGK